MAQQAFGIDSLVGREGHRRKSAQRGYMTGIFLQDFAKHLLCRLAVAGHQSRRCRFDERPLRIGQPGALESDTRIAVLLQIDQDVAVRQPRERVMRDLLEHPPHFLACLSGASVAAVSARQIDTRVREIRQADEQRFEDGDALGEFVLLQQRGAQQPQAVRLCRRLRNERAQPALGGGCAAGAQRGMGLAELLRERGL
jgi:hypothetical protein